MTDAIKDVLVFMELVEWMAKDVHYRSNDQWFYALHLLADKVDFGTAEDDLKEAYYLGFKNSLPPTEKDIHAASVGKCPDVRGMDNRSLIEALRESSFDCLYAVEEAKREPGLAAGVHAILDGVSQKMLVINGLCWRSLEDGNSSSTEKK